MLKFHKLNILSIYFCSLIVLSHQRPVYKSVQEERFFTTYDANHDGKVDIDKEIQQLSKSAPAEEGGLPSGELKKLFQLGEVETAKPLESYDANKDGLMNIKEILAFMADYAHSVLDLNHDGVVTDEEFGSVLAKNEETFFKKQDLNHDGQLDVKELSAMSGALTDSLRVIMSAVYGRDLPLEVAKLLFARFGVKPAKVEAADENGDRILGTDEFFKHLGMPMEIAKKVTDKFMAKLGIPMMDGVKMAEEADKNGDGLLNMTELMGGMFVQALVKLGDENGDGVLNPKEFLKANQMIVHKLEQKEAIN